ncbi:hypothetical protein BG006_005503 [Podila minutissima]|uniref:Uncharacterized protein n=1 Tax=Podila minutissima TaxID=64525 RepID=A0A9P5SWK4_9FUNG|nr:hypothetical protein BG006_005503 [Podila minutissima]
MALQALGDTHCFAANQDTIYFIMIASATEGVSPSMLVLGQSQRFPTSIEAITWTIISSTPITYFDTGPTFRPHLATYRCSVSSEGVFTFRYQYDDGYDSISGFPYQYDDGYDSLSGFRYDPRIQRQKRTGTCNAITPELGDWERVDLSMPDGVRFAQKIMVIPEASDAVSSGDGIGTTTGTDAWMIFFQPKGIIRYAGFDSTSYKEKIYTEDLVVMDPPASGDLESVAYGDGQLYTIQSTSYHDQALDATRYNRTLAFFPFTASYPNPHPGKVSLTDWNVDCDFGSVYSKAAKGKLYYMCLGLVNSTIHNMYIFDSKTSSTRGPVKLLKSHVSKSSLSSSLTLAYGWSMLKEPQYAIFKLDDINYAMDVYSATNTTSGVLNPIRMPVYITQEKLQWKCRDDEQDRRVAIAGAVSGAIAALLLVCRFVWRRRRRAKKAGRQSVRA